MNIHDMYKELAKLLQLFNCFVLFCFAVAAAVKDAICSWCNWKEVGRTRKNSQERRQKRNGNEKEIL